MRSLTLGSLLSLVTSVYCVDYTLFSGPNCNSGLAQTADLSGNCILGINGGSNPVVSARSGDQDKSSCLCFYADPSCQQHIGEAWTTSGLPDQCFGTGGIGAALSYKFVWLTRSGPCPC